MLDRTRPPAFTQTFEIDIPRAVSERSGSTNIHWIKAGNQPVYKIEVIFRNAGSYFDRQPGTSFLTNKMLTYGTSHRSNHEIAEAFDRLGAFIKVNPSFDDPDIELYGMRKNAPEAIELLADLVHNSTFPEDEFSLVRKISAEQMRIQNARNSVEATKLFRKTIFGEDHPYGVVMVPEDLDQLSPKLLRDFYKDQCDRYEVIVSGDVDESLLGLIREKLNKSAGEEPELTFGTPAANPAQIYIEKDKSLQTSLRIGKILPHKSHPDYIPLRICLHALGGYFGSRLMKNIREDKGYTYGIYASIVPLKHISYLVIGADVQKDHRQDAIREIQHEIMKMQENPLPESEMQMVRNHLLGSFQSDLSSPFSLSEKFKGVYLFGLDYSFYEELFDAIQGITPEKIQGIANKYLDPSSLTEISVG